MTVSVRVNRTCEDRKGNKNGFSVKMNMCSWVSLKYLVIFFFFKVLFLMLTVDRATYSYLELKIVSKVQNKDGSDGSKQMVMTVDPFCKKF